MIKEDMDETNSGYAKQVGGLKGKKIDSATFEYETCLLYTSPSPRD